MYSYVYVLLGPTVNGVATLGWSSARRPRELPRSPRQIAQGGAATTTGLLVWDGIDPQHGGALQPRHQRLFHMERPETPAGGARRAGQRRSGRSHETR